MGETIVQTVSFEKWVLETREDMFVCAAELADAGFGTLVESHAPALPGTIPEGEQVWSLGINRDSPDTRVTGVRLGMTVVLMGGVLEAVTPEQYAARFGEQ